MFSIILQRIAAKFKLTELTATVEMCGGKKIIYSCGCCILKACISVDCNDWDWCVNKSFQ